MAEITFKQSSSESGWVWLLKIVTGLLIVVILIIHLIVNHMLGTEGGLLTYADVVAYYQNPIIPIMEAVFLICVVSHCLIGLRGIIIDLNPSPKTLNGITWLLTGLGAAFVVYGIWLLMAIVAQG
jgi:succinate dehydrogenase hydrophobic anchor subunit